MGFLSVISCAHECIKQRVHPGDTVVDATCGNGVDTLFLCRVTGRKGRMYAFDIQKEAIDRTRERIMDEGIDTARITFLQQSHAEMERHIPANEHGKVAAVMFNLGFLPGGDPSIITECSASIFALQSALRMLRKGGIVTAVVYPGHPGGKEEADAVAEWASSLPREEAQTLCYRFINQKEEAPYLIAIEKRSSQLA